MQSRSASSPLPISAQTSPAFGLQVRHSSPPRPQNSFVVPGRQVVKSSQQPSGHESMPQAHWPRRSISSHAGVEQQNCPAWQPTQGTPPVPQACVWLPG